MPRRLGPALTAIALVTTLGACGNDEGAASPPEGSPSSSSSSEDIASPSDSAPDPSVSPEAPTGLVLEIETASIQVPEGYGLYKEGLATSTVEDPKTHTIIFLSGSPAFGPDTSLDEQARLVRRNTLTSGKPKIVDPVTINNVEHYHLVGPGYAAGFVLEKFGARIDEVDVVVTFEMPEDMSQSDRQALTDSVLNTLQVG